MSEKVIVLFSGGIDSTTALAMAIRDYGKDNVIAMTMSYGQKHSKELESAKSVANHYEVPLYEADLTQVYATNKSCTLLSGNADVSHKTYKEETDVNGHKPVDTYVPFRNGLMLAYVAARAEELGASLILYGSHAEDAEGGAYPDCTPKFNEAMGNAIYEGTGGQVRLQGPFVAGMKKKDVVAEGLKLNVPYELTWSCYEGKDLSCGECPSCRTRKQAFIDNGTVDPISYAEVK